MMSNAKRAVFERLEPRAFFSNTVVGIGLTVEEYELVGSTEQDIEVSANVSSTLGLENFTLELHLTASSGGDSSASGQISWIDQEVDTYWGSVSWGVSAFMNKTVRSHFRSTPA